MDRTPIKPLLGWEGYAVFGKRIYRSPAYAHVSVQEKPSGWILFVGGEHFGPFKSASVAIKRLEAGTFAPGSGGSTGNPRRNPLAGPLVITHDGPDLTITHKANPRRRNPFGGVDHARARRIVKLAAKGSRASMVKSWLTLDERGSWEKMALGYLNKPEVQAKAAELGMSEAEVDRQISVLLTYAATAAALSHAKKKGNPASKKAKAKYEGQVARGEYGAATRTMKRIHAGLKGAAKRKRNPRGYTQSFNPVDYHFRWTDGWYEWDREAAMKEARKRRDAAAKDAQSKGYRVRKSSWPNQMITRGGIGSGHPEISHVVTIYDLSVEYP